MAPSKEGEDSTSELSSKVGMLELTTDGEEPRYLGSSSVFAFSRIIHSSLRQQSHSQPRGLGLREADTAIPSPCTLPEYDFGVTLSNAYFENIHPQYPFLHEPTFRGWEERFVRPSETMEALFFDPVPLFFINMVYAVGALLISNTGALSRQLYVSAQLYIDHILARDNLEAIQAILCCAMYSLRSSAGPSIWKLSGLALRQSIELGYHRSSKRFGLMTDPLRLEMRKRVFWCAFGIDCMAALTLGRPLGIPLQEVDAEYPEDIDDANITEAGLQGTPRRASNDRPTSISTALHVFRLRCLWSRIHTSLYSDTVVYSADNQNYSDRVKQLRTELEDWLASAPPIPARIGPPLSIFATKDWYDFNYSETIIMLYRGQLNGNQPVEESVFMECARAAENICHGYRRQYIGKPVNYTWGTLHVLFSAGLTYLHCLWTSSAVRDAVRFRGMSATFMDCSMLLAVIAERWSSAGPYRDLFEALCNRTTTMMMDKRCDRGTPTTPQMADYVNPEDLTQWMTDISDVGMSDGIDKLLNGLVSEDPLQGLELERLSDTLHDIEGNFGMNGGA